MNLRHPLIVAGCLSFALGLANATPIAGDFGMGGSATVTAISLTFNCDLGGCPAGSGDFTVSPITTTGNFTGLGNTTGFIKSLNQGAGQPLNTAFVLAQWISFVAAPNLFLDLNFIPLGTAPSSQTCAGLTFCTPIIPALIGSPNNPAGLSAFNLGPGNASFEVRGIGYLGSAATGSTPFVGRFSADFPGLTAADIVALFNNPGVANKAYSAAFTLTFIPEPSTGMMMIGGVLLGIGGFLRKRVRNKS